MLTAPRKRFAFSAYIRLLAVQEEAIFVVNPSGNCGRAGGVWGLSKEGRNENFFFKGVLTSSSLSSKQADTFKIASSDHRQPPPR